MRRIAFLSTILCGMIGACCVRAWAGEGSLCRPLAEMKASAIEHKARWTVLSPDQWQFARAVSVMNPQTPSGIPFGESAALVQFGDVKDGGVIVFVDGDMACEPMPVPSALVEMLMDLGSIRHEGDGL